MLRRTSRKNELRGIVVESAPRWRQRGGRLLSSEDMIIIDFEFPFVNNEDG